MTVKNNLSALRQKRGAAATELAHAAGVSRQTIYSIESGAFTPNTAVALRMARFLNVSVEDIFSIDDETPRRDAIKARSITPRVHLYQGQPVQVCQVGDQVVAVPGSGFADRYPKGVNGLVVKGAKKASAEAAVDVFNSAAIDSGLIVAGCDPAATLFEEPLFEAGIRMVPWFCNSSEAIELVRLGLAHVAGCHMRDAKTGESNTAFARRAFRPNEAVLLSFVEWQQGFVVAQGNPKKIEKIEDLARRDVRIVNREAGSGTRLLLDDLLLKAAIPPAKVRGYSATLQTHLAVARRVREGKADCGICIGSAARLLGLTFVPLIQERYDFIVRKELLNSRQVQPLFEVLNRRSMQQTLRNLCGYEPGSSQTVTPV